MKVEEFVAQLINKYNEGNLKEWLIDYILKTFMIENMSDITDYKKQVKKDIKTLNNNLKDYMKLSEKDKKKIYKEDLVAAEERLTNYISIKEQLIKDIDSLYTLFFDMQEKAKEETLKNFFGEILKALEETKKNQNDIDIAKNSLEEIKNQDYETTVKNTIAIIKATIEQKEKLLANIEDNETNLKNTLAELEDLL